MRNQFEVSTANVFFFSWFFFSGFSLDTFCPLFIDPLFTFSTTSYSQLKSKTHLNVKDSNDDEEDKISFNFDDANPVEFKWFPPFETDESSRLIWFFFWHCIVFVYQSLLCLRRERAFHSITWHIKSKFFASTCWHSRDVSSILSYSCCWVNFLKRQTKSWLQCCIDRDSCDLIGCLRLVNLFVTDWMEHMIMLEKTNKKSSTLQNIAKQILGNSLKYSMMPFNSLVKILTNDCCYAT